MCGRYASSRSADDLAREFDVAERRGAGPFEADYNVAPTKPVPAIVQRPPSREAGQAGEPAVRQLRTLTWGLVPSWAKDPSIGSRLINARMETVAEKPAFRKAFAARRCLLPADGYYEWYPTEQRTAAGRPRKQPFFIHPRDGGVLAMAGLYEIWRDPDRAEDDPDRFRWSCTVITTAAEDDLGRIHERMPLMVDPARRPAWLDPQTPASDLMALLEPASPGRLAAHPVGQAVGNVRNNGPELCEPIPLEDVEPLAPQAAEEDTT